MTEAGTEGGSALRPNLATVAAAVSGDVLAQHTLVEAVWPDAYHLALTILRNPVAAEDVAQEVAVILLRSIRQLADPGAFNSWFYRIVTRESLHELKRRPSEEPTAPRQGQVADAEDRAAFTIAFGALSTMERTVVVLHYHYGFTSREIARLVSRPAGTVRYHLVMARRHLRAALGETLGGDENHA